MLNSTAQQSARKDKEKDLSSHSNNNNMNNSFSSCERPRKEISLNEIEEKDELGSPHSHTHSSG